MKKSILVLACAFGMFAVSCGPSAEEKAAAEKAMQDSIAEVVKKAYEDSMAVVQAQQKALEDSTMAVQEKMRADSLQKALEASQRKASKPKTTTTTKPETPKVGKKKPGMN